MVPDQFQLFLIFCFAGKSSSDQSSSIVHCWLALKEEIDILISKNIHLITLSHETQSSKELCWPVQTHNFWLYSVVGGFYASVFLFERVAYDAAWEKCYLAVNLHRMLSP
jgi:hypothetical protein